MKRIFAIAIACLGLTALFSGCVSTVDGHMKTGVPFVKDRIESRYQFTPAQIATATRAVLKHNGEIVNDDAVTKTITAKVATRTVWVRTVEINQQVTQVIIQARTKSGGADVDLASEIDKQIALRLAAGR